MATESRTRSAQSLELGAGVAAAVTGLAGLWAYLYLPSMPHAFCGGADGMCISESVGLLEAAPSEQVVTAVVLWMLSFLAVGVGAYWDYARPSLSARVLLRVGTVQAVVATAAGLLFGPAFIIFVPGAVLALTSSVTAGAHRR